MQTAAGVFFGLLSLLAAGQPAFKVTATPSACLAPCSLSVELWIKPDASNRWAVVEVDGPEFHGTRIQLEGELAPYHTQLPPFLLASEGGYTVKGMLYNSVKEIARQQLTIKVGGNQ